MSNLELIPERTIDERAQEIAQRFFDAIDNPNLETSSFVAYFVVGYEDQDRLRAELLDLLLMKSSTFSYEHLDGVMDKAVVLPIVRSSMTNNTLIQTVDLHEGDIYGYRYEVVPQDYYV